MKRKASSPVNRPAKQPKQTQSTSQQESDVNLETFFKNIDKNRREYFLRQPNFNEKRIKHVVGKEENASNKRGVLYWMSRDQRVQDNWAFIYAQKISLKYKCNLHVCFCLVPKFLDATIRHYDFMLRGLQEVEKECRDLNIKFHLLTGYAKDRLPQFIIDNDIGAIVNDFSPLRVPLKWVKELSQLLPKQTFLCQVDAHNVVPVWEASPKLEVGARTLRSKINKQLNEFLTEFPPIIKSPNGEELPPTVDWEAVRKTLEVDLTVKPVSCFLPGSKAGINNLYQFSVSKKLLQFNTNRNNPTKDCLSNISPWLHFGQISAQRCILEVQKQKSRAREGVDIFTEEALVRRELADNYCYYNTNYDCIAGASNWAIETLNRHRFDQRPHKYSLEELNAGKTYDKLWNAAQLQMVREGKMHGFLRMYWAKKILEWTQEGPEEALKRAIYLNDRYSIDGRDPNGYVGIMWSICGVHDQGWREREVFGKVRYMNYQGCKRKFDVELFERTYR